MATKRKAAARAIPAGQFKAKCLGLLDDVAYSGRELIVTKHGKPVAKIVPVEPAHRDSMKGSITFEGDIVAPIDVQWDAAR